jgi:hypothetical protein
MKVYLSVFSVATDELIEEIPLDSITENELMDILNIDKGGIYGAFELTSEMVQLFSRLDLKFDFKNFSYYVESLTDG